ncbi:methyltransferase domain-containing protein [Actinomadura monticuli]|uniref:DNA topoisomerase (ATP-hydrolyzing) n=1 Tax=Actinomadura monticuli TaxID=3097367 RepID=A0ABV4Q5Z0_9ACTN
MAYDPSSIVVLSDMESVRRAPSMYVGSTGAAGLHQLVYELIDNAVDEAAAGYCRTLSVIVHADGSCEVADDGRGIPVDAHPDTGRPACEVALTTLHSGGKFEGNAYGVSAGLHGVGLVCVNALSSRLDLSVRRDGKLYRQSYAGGRPLGDVVPAGEAEGHGTTIRFVPDPEIMEVVDVSAETLSARLAEIAYLQPGLRVTFTDERTGLHRVMRGESEVRGLLEERRGDAVPVHPEPIVVTAGDGELSVQAAFQWTEGYAEKIWSYVNTVRTQDGGDHVDGLRLALTEALLASADTPAAAEMTVPDLLEGLVAVVSVRTARPQFAGQSKRLLAKPEIGAFVRDEVGRAFAGMLTADPGLGLRVLRRASEAARARAAARLARRPSRYERREIEVDYEIYRRQFGIRSADWHDSCAWLTDEGLLNSHVELCDVPADARMLDVCCGSGVVGGAFQGRVGESVGLDITPEMLRLAADRLDVVDQGTVYDLPYPDASFDLVVNREVLHLLPGPEGPVSEIFRVLRPGGQFIVGQIMPYSDVDAYWMYRIFKKKQPLLFQMFGEEQFRDLLLGAGFGDLRMTTHHLWESIDQWTDSHETTPRHRQEIYRLFYDAPKEVRAVHPFEIGADGSVRDCWRWCVYSVRKPVS